MGGINPKVDLFVANGCGRCKLGGTPACKIHGWAQAIEALRAICIRGGLTEELKWGVPCYTIGNSKNVILLGVLKEYCCIGFLKGALMKDEKGILIQQTDNVQSARQVRFTNVAQVWEIEDILLNYIAEAIGIEQKGIKLDYKKTEEFPVPVEFEAKFAEFPALKTAFEALTPGRQRGYLLHFAQPKQSQTRTSRIEKCMERIFEGKGLMD